LLNIIKIDPYNVELYRFKVGSFFRHNVEPWLGLRGAEGPRSRLCQTRTDCV